MRKKTTFFLALLSIFVLWSPGYVLAETGYDQSVTMWQEVVARISPYRSSLQNLYAEVESKHGLDKRKLSQAFAKRLRDEYPGSYYIGGMHGQLAINDYTKLGFDSHWNITVLSQRFGSLSKIYNFRQNTLEITNGPNKISMRFDLRYPSRSRFTQAIIPAISMTAKNIWLRKGSSSGYPSPLRDILNDVYAYKIAAENSIRMDQLAENMINNEGTRHYVLKDANELYRRGITRRTSKKISPIKVAPGSLSRQVLLSSNRGISLFWVLGLGVVGMLILRVATNSARRGAEVPDGAWEKSLPPKKKSAEGDDGLYESCETLHSPAEQAFNKILQQVIDDDRYQINGKTRLADLVKVGNQQYGEEWWAQFKRIAYKHVDFVLLEKPSSRIVGVIELDDSSHQRPDRQERDRFVDRALESAGIPILHYPCMREYVLADVENMLRETFVIDLKISDFEMGPVKP